MTRRALNGTQKAAVFILHMGKERSAKVLQSLRETEVADIMSEVARLRTVDGEVVEDVISEFKEMAGAKVAITAGGLELARSLLEESLGDAKANEILDRVTASCCPSSRTSTRRRSPWCWPT
jgi:flagellar motor switch protein FliG